MSVDGLEPKVFGCIDNTTLSVIDNESSVAAFCKHTLGLVASGHSVASVCVYPRFVGVAKKELANSGISVVSVAGAFPHGQLPLVLKVAEVNYAVVQGADEVDVVINRGLVIDDRLDEAMEEVEAMKEACQGRVLKVIIEVCDLNTTNLIRQATEVALVGGADFVKTSTGKGKGGATIEAAEIILDTIADYYGATGCTVGFKVAGGIKRPEEALEYARLAKSIMGEEYIDKRTFRIGASSLTDEFYTMLKA